MHDLIRIDYDRDTPTVSGRELHASLEVNTDYPHWFSRMCEYGVEYNQVRNFEK